MFPKLNQVVLRDLPNLVTLCQGIGSIEFPLLTKMEIQRCPKMKSMVSSEENNCGGSRNADIIDDYHSPHLFCQPQNVGNAFYCQKIPVSFFNGLEELTVCGYEGSLSLFTSSIAQNFVNLRGLSIEECHEIVKVIKDEEEEKAASGGERPLLFPKLEKLELTKLESFCEWNCDVNCRIMKFDGCSNYIIKIFNLGSNVSFSFHRLEELTISNYEGGMSLFPSSMAANILVSLRKLEISFCQEMVKVIEDEKEVENVVSSGGAQTTTTILFPKLQELKLWFLWKLESFCEWKCDVELPSLKKLEINYCSNMKIFSPGLITPNLESVEIDRNKVLESGEKDLNGALERYLARQKEEQRRVRLASINSMIEFSSLFATDEDEETKSEIEEEQNW
ncbi:hypothetical protein C2S51_036206 [Perilla frutescens var. frutescens]|nr:hypothetical protein C2S51_036206 [Perilla frutescens var. frutescens]